MELTSNVSGRIFDIQGFSVHDGPGARSLIFLKGCSLSCFWCSNPEGISQSDVPLYYASKCIGCLNCVAACQHDAIHIIDGKHIIDRDICEQCKDPLCIETCYTDAMRMSGRTINVEELFTILQRDRHYWGENGGVTFGGGEPLLQLDFIRSILKKCHDAFIHTAIETCGQVAWKNFEKTIGYIDWIFFDLKHIDPERHKTGTGQGNRKIIDNIRKLNETYNGRMVFRLPLVPGFNDKKEDIEGLAAMIAETKWKEINILPVHHLGREKYTFLGMDYKGLDFPPPSSDELMRAKAIFTKAGIDCYIGHATPF
ncbi:MAG: glycyl-radical enzyme activating protein [Bacteroidetes bacterium]|nr:glycyl-radical enzyme activating protein [Bacteroidota bacterium]